MRIFAKISPKQEVQQNDARTNGSFWPCFQPKRYESWSRAPHARAKKHFGLFDGTNSHNIPKSPHLIAFDGSIRRVVLVVVHGWYTNLANLLKSLNLAEMFWQLAQLVRKFSQLAQIINFAYAYYIYYTLTWSRRADPCARVDACMCMWRVCMCMWRACRVHPPIYVSKVGTLSQMLLEDVSFFWKFQKSSGINGRGNRDATRTKKKRSPYRCTRRP